MPSVYAPYTVYLPVTVHGFLWQDCLVDIINKYNSIKQNTSVNSKHKKFITVESYKIFVGFIADGARPEDDNNGENYSGNTSHVLSVCISSWLTINYKASY